MKLAQMNDYLQTLATLGALVGLIVVGYEIRQSNVLANQQMASASWTNWTASVWSHIDSDISATIAKSITQPEELTLREKIDLDQYFTAFVYAYAHDTNTFWYTDREFLNSLLEELTGEAPRVLGGAYGRAWLEENRGWMDDDLYQAIRQGLDGATVGSDQAYYDRIDRRVAEYRSG